VEPQRFGRQAEVRAIAHRDAELVVAKVLSSYGRIDVAEATAGPVQPSTR